MVCYCKNVANPYSFIPTLHADVAISNMEFNYDMSWMLMVGYIPPYTVIYYITTEFESTAVVGI